MWQASVSSSSKLKRQFSHTIPNESKPSSSSKQKSNDNNNNATDRTENLHLLPSKMDKNNGKGYVYIDI